MGGTGRCGAIGLFRALVVRNRRNARPMRRRDFASVHFLNVRTAREILHEVAATAPVLAAKAR
jgi:hypothetical protein